MGACYNEGFRRGNTSSTRNRRKINSSDKDSISTQSYDKKKGKNYNRTPNMRISDIKSEDKNMYKGNEIFDNDSNRNNNSKFDIISKIEQESFISEFENQYF